MLRRQVKTRGFSNDHLAVGKMKFDECVPVPNRSQIVSSPAPKAPSRRHHRCCNPKLSPKPFHPPLPLRSVPFDRRSPVCIPISYLAKSKGALLPETGTPAHWKKHKKSRTRRQARGLNDISGC